MGLLMSTHNICFSGEIRKIFTLYPLLSEAKLSITQNMKGPSTVCTNTNVGLYCLCWTVSLETCPRHYSLMLNA